MQAFGTKNKFGFLIFYAYLCIKKERKDMEEKIAILAYQIVCKYIPIESEPEGIATEYELRELIKKTLDLGI